MSGRLRLLLALAGPLGVWALHFILTYAVLSAACAPRALLSPSGAGLAVLALTVVCVPAAFLPILRMPGLAGRELGWAIRWMAAIATAAILFNALPFLLTEGCG